jgi:hypothetical protein
MNPITKKLSILFILIFSMSAHAAPVVFTDSAAFNTAISSYSNSTLNFDSSAAGSLIADGGTLGGITFNYPTLASFGVTMQIITGSPTTSGLNFLGTDDGNLFQAGDGFSLSFAASHAIGMFFISADPMFDDDIELTVNSTTAFLKVSDAIVLDAFNNAYFLGIVDDTNTFNSVEVSSLSTCGVCFLYNVDDITTATTPSSSIPAPSVIWLLVAGLLPMLRNIKARS